MPLPETVSEYLTSGHEVTDFLMIWNRVEQRYRAWKKCAYGCDACKRECDFE